MAISPRYRLLAVLPLVMIGGCEGGVDVDITQMGDRIAIAVSPRTSSSTPCVKDVSVYRGNDEATAIWQVSQAADGGCVNRFVIGVTPAGFASGVAYRPPTRGVTYTIDVSGTGFIGGATFVVGNRDGRIGHG